MMKHWHGIAALFLTGLAAAPTSTLALATPSIGFGNQDTRLTLQADASAPRILRLASPSGAAWESAVAQVLIDHAMVDGATRQLHWQFDRAASRVQATSLTLVYETHNPDLRLYWEWQARSQHGPLEHSIRIDNRSGREVWIPLQDSLSFDWQAQPNQALQQLWIDKGAGKAPPVGTHLANIGDGYRWLGESSTFAHPRADEPREIIPYFLVQPADDSASGWYLGVEFSGRIAMSLQRHGDTLQGRAGLNPRPGPFRTRLASGESFVTPTIFLGASRGSIDDAGNALRRWVREVLNDPRRVRDPTYPWLTNNSWGSGMAIDAAQARRMIDDSRELGFEMFHLDAGWFRGVGDWYPDPRKFPKGLATIADYAHRRGLKFGLWVDWAQAGNSRQAGALSVENPAMRDWLTTDPPSGWKPAEFKGITVDIGQPAVQAWVSKEVGRIVHDYDLDMLEHDGYVVAQGCDRGDHLHATCDPQDVHRYADEDFIWMDGPNSTDVSYHATRAYYAIYTQLKREHPRLLLEICNDGGRMVDFGSAAHGDYFSIVDSYDPLSNRQAFYDASHVLPPAMLETYVKQWPAPRIENFRYVLRSGMMGWFTLMLDTTGWSRAQHDAALQELRLYKTTLRPLIRAADLY
ncbi:MAG: glycoside hydrolase family 36 protein, partial [Rudaea sp.]